MRRMILLTLLSILVAKTSAILINIFILNNNKLQITQEENVNVNFIKVYKNLKNTNYLKIKKNDRIKKNNKIINDYSIINDINIYAIYINNDDKLVFIKNKKNKNFFLKEKQYYKDYIVNKIYKNKIALTKKGTTTFIYFYKNKDKKNINNKEVLYTTNDYHNNLVYNNYRLKRETINKYLNDFKEIFKSVAIRKKNNFYYIYRIIKNSYFYNIGLRKGDIIHTINDEIVSDALLANLYKNINNIDNINLGIERNKKKIELNFEIE